MYSTQTPSEIKGIPLLVFTLIPPAHPRALPTFVLMFLECCRCWGHPGSSLVTVLSWLCAVLCSLGSVSQHRHWRKRFFLKSQPLFLQLDRLGLVQVF